MARKRKEYEDDDGRTIADMSALDGVKKSRRNTQIPNKEEKPWEDAPYTRSERTMFALGATGAALLIGLAFLLGIGLCIGILLLVWHIL